MSRRKHGADELVSEFRAAMAERGLWWERRHDYEEAVLEALMQQCHLTRKQAVRFSGDRWLDDDGNLAVDKIPETIRVAAKDATAKKHGVTTRTVERWIKEGHDREASPGKTVHELWRVLEEMQAPSHPLIDEFKALESALPPWESHGDWKAATFQEEPEVLMGHGVLWRKMLLHLATRRVALSRRLELRVFKSAQRIEKLEAENLSLRKELKVATNELKTEKQALMCLRRDTELARAAHELPRTRRR